MTGHKELMFAEERKRKIIELLNDSSKLLVPELCERFGVSPATIRNDLRYLEENGHLKRTHGGAIRTTRMSYELDTRQKEVKNLVQKQAIAKYAAQMIEDGDTIAIDTGTTGLQFAKAITNHTGLTVVTNDIKIAGYLEENLKANIILIGGTIRLNYNCTVGYLAVNALKGLSVDKAFMATNGLTPEKGLSTPDMSQAEVKKAMLEISSEVIVLCDSSKIGSTAFVQVAPTSVLDYIVTDSQVNEKYVNEFQLLGVAVKIANLQNDNK